MSIKATTLAMLGLLGASAGTASAQVMYNGWNLGPDYGQMLQEQLRRQQMMNQQMGQQVNQVVQQAMQDPRCQAMYQQYRAGGGTMPFPQFAYQYVATRGFTPEGTRFYQQNEANNRAQETERLRQLRQAEQQRGDAQRQMNDRNFANNQERGRMLNGNGSWIDPSTGQRQVLPYMGPNAPVTDPRTGNQYARDERGQYWVRTPGGQVFPMQPGP